MESARAQKPEAGIQPSQPQQSQQQPQQAPQQQPAPNNNGNYAGAPLTGFDTTHFQGMWVSPCLSQTPQFWPAGPAFAANSFRQMSYTFYNGNQVTYTVGDYRDAHCTAALGISHSETGIWRSTFVDPTQPLAGEIEFTFDTCSGGGCHPYNPSVGPYSVTRSVIRLYANLLEFGHAVVLQGFSGLVFDQEHPWYQACTQPGALQAYCQQ